jgi:PAS domain S-box-containing protein
MTDPEVFKSTLRDHGEFELLFEYLPDIYFYVKDRQLSIVMCNSALLSLFNLGSKSDIIGRMETDFFPSKLADSIHQDDQKVLDSAKPLLNRIELIADEQGRLIWASSNKLPLFDHQQQVVGLMGTTRKLQREHTLPESHERFAATLEYIQTHYAEPIEIDDLASMSCLSESHFRRVFREVFGTSPQQFILRYRLQVASRVLVQSHTPISQVAEDCGFCDQSYFTRQFRKTLGLSPKMYRSQWR